MSHEHAVHTGLHFINYYHLDKEKAKEDVKVICKLGFKAKIITIYSNSHSVIQDDGITGWAVCADEKYVAYKTIKSLKRRKYAMTAKLSQALIKYQNVEKKIKKQQKSIQISIEKCKAIFDKDIKLKVCDCEKMFAAKDIECLQEVLKETFTRLQKAKNDYKDTVKKIEKEKMSIQNDIEKMIQIV